MLVLLVIVVSTGCSREVSYQSDVAPILAKNCVACHGGSGEGVTKTGLDLESYGGLMRGTKLGPVVVPGNSTGSTLFRVIDHDTDPTIHMPPHVREALPEGRGKTLSPGHVELVREWIDQGAKNN